MSRGPGRIERAIRELFDARPPDGYGGFSAEAMCEYVYPGVAIERKHRVAVLRAAHKIVAADPEWTFEREPACPNRREPAALEFFRQDNPPTWVQRKRERVQQRAEWLRHLPQRRLSLANALSSRQPAEKATLTALAANLDRGVIAGRARERNDAVSGRSAIPPPGSGHDVDQYGPTPLGWREAAGARRWSMWVGDHS
jgi:hypothetical protein